MKRQKIHTEEKLASSINGGDLNDYLYVEESD